MTTVDEHEFYKMMRTREARITTFMQLELEVCLKEVTWMIRCHNCEALNCPYEEYSAMLLPTPPTRPTIGGGEGDVTKFVPIFEETARK